MPPGLIRLIVWSNVAGIILLAAILVGVSLLY